MRGLVAAAVAYAATAAPLRNRWDEELLFTPLAKQIHDAQFRPCPGSGALHSWMTVADIDNMNIFRGGKGKRKVGRGLGSDLHVYSMSLCLALERKAVLAVDADWFWSRDDDGKLSPGEFGGLFAPSNACPWPPVGGAASWQNPLPLAGGIHCQWPHARQFARQNTECLDADGRKIRMSPLLLKSLTTASPRNASSPRPRTDARRAGVASQTWQRTDALRDGVYCQFPNRRQTTKYRTSVITPEHVTTFRRAAMEFLFRKPPAEVVAAARAAAGRVFGPAGAPSGLITVHIRWGDKRREMKLVPISRYVQAIEDFIKDRPGPVHVFVVSEDPRAVQGMRRAGAARNWNVHAHDAAIDQDVTAPHVAAPAADASDYTDMMRVDKAYRKPEMPEDGDAGSGYVRYISDHVPFNRRTGLVSLATLLVALEAEYYVLSLGSNWSRLIDELRRTRVDGVCRGCTKMVDLTPGQGCSARMPWHC